MSNIYNNEMPSFFSILSATVRYDKRLSASEKLFYSEISALTNRLGFCSASNNYFMSLYNVDSRTVQRWLNKLANLNYIKIEYISKNTRKIYLDFSYQCNTFQNNISSHITNRKIESSCIRDFINSIH